MNIQMNMPKAFSRLLLLLCAVCSGGAPATADGPDYYRLNATVPEAERVMLSEPRQDAVQILALPVDAQCLRSLGCQGGLSLQDFTKLSEAEKRQRQAANPRWCKLAYQGRTGWVQGRFLSEAACTEAAQDARQESISLARESGATTIKGRLNGREYVDYQLQAYAGQTLLVSLAASNGQTYFNLNPPGAELSMFVGSTSGKRFKTLLPADGIYTVRVYLMRAAARRHESSRYTVKFNLTGKPLAPRPAHSDALIPGTPFHASPTQSN